MDRPNYAQFGNQVYASRPHVRVEANQAGGTNDHIVDGNRVGKRGESELPTRIRQLESRLKDVEQAKVKIKEA